MKNPRIPSCILIVAPLIGFVGSARPMPHPIPKSEALPTVQLCELIRNPKQFDGKHILVTAKINLEFEDFSLYDTACSSRPDVWLVFGGDVSTPTMSTVNDTQRPAGKDIKINGVEYTITKNPQLTELQNRLNAHDGKKRKYRVTATLEGAFFAGKIKEEEEKAGRPWFGPGYGHLGCCRLFVITEVKNVTYAPMGKNENEKWDSRKKANSTQ